MKQYLDLLRHVKENGVSKSDRTEQAHAGVFGYQMRFNLEEDSPYLQPRNFT